MNRERRENTDQLPSGNALLEEIRALSFVKVELELYLDTHPNCRTALDYYRKTVDALDELMIKYHNEKGPLRAEGVLTDDGWTWVSEPWPWQAGNGASSGKAGK